MSAPMPKAVFAEAMERPLRVGLLSQHNPFDRSAFSGTVHHAARALSAAGGIELKVLGGHRAIAWHHGLSRRFRPLRPVAASPAELAGLDVVVGLVATDLLNGVAALTRVPLVHVTDATPAFLRDVYGWDVPAAASLAEARVLAAARRVIYSSDYMAERAVAEFGPAIGSRVCAVPFGTNLDNLPLAMPHKPGPDPLRLLWVGSDWVRKGGEIAVAAFDILRAAGCDVHLTLVGDVPAHVAPGPRLTVAGYLDKNRPRHAARLRALYAEAHLFLLPTRADCTPMVLAEAGAHGTPVLVTETGGVGSLVREGVNGRLLPSAATPTDWARAVRSMTSDRARHEALCRASFGHARARLSWDAWAGSVAAHLRDEVTGPAHRPAAA